MVKGVVVYVKGGVPIGAVLEEGGGLSEYLLSSLGESLRVLFDVFREGELSKSLNIIGALQRIEEDFKTKKILLVGYDVKEGVWNSPGGEYQLHLKKIPIKDLYYVVLLDEEDNPEEIYKKLLKKTSNREYILRLMRVGSEGMVSMGEEETGDVRSLLNELYQFLRGK